MKSLVRPELPTASAGSSQAPTAAVDNSASSVNRPEHSTYKSGKAVQTNGATSVNTGYTDPTGLPIMKAQYVGTSLGTIPKILPIINGWSMTSFTNLTALWDGLYTSGANWNAGANWGSVSLDLGSIKTVRGVRLTMRSSSTDTSIDFAVLGDNSGLTTVSTVLGYHNEPYASDLAPVYIPLSGANVRYLRIDGNAYGSWLSYSEIEVYGD